MTDSEESRKNLLRKIAAFDIEQHKFREKFRTLPIFRDAKADGKSQIERARGELERFLTKEEELLGEAQEAGQQTPAFNQLRQCVADLEIAEQLWELLDEAKEPGAAKQELMGRLVGLGSVPKAWIVYDALQKMITSLNE
eukprot:c28907_g1_i1.p1 GENE.c28907_g1_i1~~c28907_g1_i1.p1  ORF type:complete len:140 (+),score=44.96 c28907_g1_i1:38-457(+)